MSYCSDCDIIFKKDADLMVHAQQHITRLRAENRELIEAIDAARMICRIFEDALNRLNEIEERWEGKAGGLHVEDIKYLLTRLREAEKVVRWYADESNGDDEGKNARQYFKKWAK